MSETIITHAKNLIEKLNIFKVFQVVWLIEFYFLAIFSGKQTLETILNISINEPEFVSKYRAIIFGWLTEYNAFIFYLAVILLIVGLSGGCVAKLPVLKNNKFICTYVDFGWYSGWWLIFIGFTYCVYNWWEGLFLFIPLIVYIVCKLLKKLLEKIGFVFD